MKRYKILDTTDNNHIGAYVLVDEMNKLCYIGHKSIKENYDFIINDGQKLRIMTSNYTITVES
jgi:hypothetical protein